MKPQIMLWTQSFNDSNRYHLLKHHPQIMLKELTKHIEIKRRLQADFYFVDSYLSWQQSSHESTSELIRQYASKGSDFRVLSNHVIQEIENVLNNYVRKKLDYKTHSHVILSYKPM